MEFNIASMKKIQSDWFFLFYNGRQTSVCFGFQFLLSYFYDWEIPLILNAYHKLNGKKKTC